MEGSWAELCETEAIKAAKVFAQTYHNYRSSQDTNGQTSDSNPDPSRVGQLFVEHFQEHFELELRRATIVINGNANVTPVEPPSMWTITSTAQTVPLPFQMGTLPRISAGTVA